MFYDCFYIGSLELDFSLKLFSLQKGGAYANAGGEAADSIALGRAVRPSEAL